MLSSFCLLSCLWSFRMYWHFILFFTTLKIRQISGASSGSSFCAVSFMNSLAQSPCFHSLLLIVLPFPLPPCPHWHLRPQQGVAIIPPAMVWYMHSELSSLCTSHTAKGNVAAPPSPLFGICPFTPSTQSPNGAPHPEIQWQATPPLTLLSNFCLFRSPVGQMKQFHGLYRIIWPSGHIFEIPSIEVPKKCVSG